MPKNVKGFREKWKEILFLKADVNIISGVIRLPPPPSVKLKVGRSSHIYDAPAKVAHESESINDAIVIGRRDNVKELYHHKKSNILL